MPCIGPCSWYIFTSTLTDAESPKWLVQFQFLSNNKQSRKRKYGVMTIELRENVSQLKMEAFMKDISKYRVFPWKWKNDAWTGFYFEYCSLSRMNTYRPSRKIWIWCTYIINIGFFFHSNVFLLMIFYSWYGPFYDLNLIIMTMAKYLANFSESALSLPPIVNIFLL